MTIMQNTRGDDSRPDTISASIARMRSEGSFGVGDFGDLAAFIEQAARNGAAASVCVPPTTDTVSTHTDADATPYSAVSVYALHPLLVDLRQLPPIADPEMRWRMESVRQRLNAGSFDYCATLQAKLEYMSAIFAQEGDRTMHSAAYRRFFSENERWIVPYVQYAYLRDAYSIADFRRWPNHNEWTEAERGALQNARTKAYKKLAPIFYTQYVLHSQLRAVHCKARANGIRLVGDMTANINPNGCDMWQDRADVGSDRWWTRRLNAMGAFYDACRVGGAVMDRMGKMDGMTMPLLQS